MPVESNAPSLAPRGDTIIMSEAMVLTALPPPPSLAAHHTRPPRPRPRYCSLDMWGTSLYIVSNAGYVAADALRGFVDSKNIRAGFLNAFFLAMALACLVSSVFYLAALDDDTWGMGKPESKKVAPTVAVAVTAAHGQAADAAEVVSPAIASRTTNVGVLCAAPEAASATSTTSQAVDSVCGKEGLQQVDTAVVTFSRMQQVDTAVVAFSPPQKLLPPKDAAVFEYTHPQKLPSQEAAVVVHTRPQSPSCATKAPSGSPLFPDLASEYTNIFGSALYVLSTCLYQYGGHQSGTGAVALAILWIEVIANLVYLANAYYSYRIWCIEQGEAEEKKETDGQEEEGKDDKSDGVEKQTRGQVKEGKDDKSDDAGREAGRKEKEGKDDKSDGAEKQTRGQVKEGKGDKNDDAEREAGWQGKESEGKGCKVEGAEASTVKKRESEKDAESKGVKSKKENKEDRSGRGFQGEGKEKSVFCLSSWRSFRRLFLHVSAWRDLEQLLNFFNAAASIIYVIASLIGLIMHYEMYGTDAILALETAGHLPALAFASRAYIVGDVFFFISSLIEYADLRIDQLKEQADWDKETATAAAAAAIGVDGGGIDISAYRPIRETDAMKQQTEPCSQAVCGRMSTFTYAR